MLVTTLISTNFHCTTVIRKLHWLTFSGWIRIAAQLSWCWTVLHCTIVSSTALHCNDVLYCTVLYCTVLYCTVLYCTVLYCTAAVSTTYCDLGPGWYCAYVTPQSSREIWTNRTAVGAGVESIEGNRNYRSKIPAGKEIAQKNSKKWKESGTGPWNSDFRFHFKWKLEINREYSWESLAVGVIFYDCLVAWRRQMISTVYCGCYGH